MLLEAYGVADVGAPCEGVACAGRRCVPAGSCVRSGIPRGFGGPANGFRMIFLVIPAFLAPNVSFADIYAAENGQGIAHFTNVPVRGDARYKRVLKIQKVRLDENGRGQADRESGYDGNAILQRSSRYREQIARAAESYQVDEALIKAVIQAESGFRSGAVSHKGAIGLMQLMPATARRYGVHDPYDPGQNIDGGVRYLRDLLGMFGNNLELAIAAYNAGENAVIRHGFRIPPYRETSAYVPKVLQLYEKLRFELQAARISSMQGG